MILSNDEIDNCIHDGRIVIQPFDPRLVKRNSYLLRLASLFRVIDNKQIIDICDPTSFDLENCPLIDSKTFVIEPGKFVLGCSLERISIPRDMIGILSGISNVARLGIQIHTTSYLINAGYGLEQPSRITFEISTVASMRVKLYYNMPICHLVFIKMTGPTSYPIPSARTGQDGPEFSNLFDQFGHFINEGLNIASNK